MLSKLFFAMASGLGFSSGDRRILHMGVSNAHPRLTRNLLPATRTRIRIEGRARKGGAKLEKRAVCGTLTLRNFSKGGYGENLREAMNKRNTGFYSRT